MYGRRSRFSRYRRYRRPIRSFRRRSRKTYRRKKLPKLTRGTKVYKFKRTARLGTLNIASGTGITQAYTFNLAQVPNYSEFVNLYDEYKIIGVKFRMSPWVDSNIQAGTNMGKLYYAFDPNDDTAWTTVDQALQYNSCKMRNVNSRPWSVYFRPLPRQRLYESGSNDAFGPYRGWIATTDYSTPHYCLKMISETPNTTMSILIHATYYLKFKYVV